MKLSIVTTLYRSAATVDEFCRRALAAGAALSDDVELVLVNDGSPDDSLARAVSLHDSDPRIVVVDLSRNFGHYRALMTGLAQARGDLIFMIDSDLEEEPELLAGFHREMSAGSWDVVYGVQDARKGGWFERFSGRLFYFVQNWLSDHDLPPNLLTARLMTRQYVKALLRHRDRQFMIAHLLDITGFKQRAMTVTKHSLSPTTYSLRRRIEVAVHQITTTSTLLLYLILYFGLLVSSVSAAVVVYVLVRYALHGIAVSGYASIFISIWFFGGLTIAILGILGVYIANILEESRRRPYVIVRKLYRAAEQDAPR